jgi:hypothetical protein
MVDTTSRRSFEQGNRKRWGFRMRWCRIAPWSGCLKCGTAKVSYALDCEIVNGYTAKMDGRMDLHTKIFVTGGAGFTSGRFLAAEHRLIGGLTGTKRNGNETVFMGAS